MSWRIGREERDCGKGQDKEEGNWIRNSGKRIGKGEANIRRRYGRGGGWRKRDRAKGLEEVNDTGSRDMSRDHKRAERALGMGEGWERDRNKSKIGENKSREVDTMIGERRNIHKQQLVERGKRQFQFCGQGEKGRGQ